MDLKMHDIHQQARALGYIVGFIDGAVVYKHVEGFITEEDASGIIKQMSTKQFANYIKEYDEKESMDFIEAIKETMSLDVFGAYMGDGVCIRDDNHICEYCPIKTELCDYIEKSSVSEYWYKAHKKMFIGRNESNG